MNKQKNYRMNHPIVNISFHLTYDNLISIHGKTTHE